MSNTKRRKLSDNSDFDSVRYLEDVEKTLQKQLPDYKYDQLSKYLEEIAVLFTTTIDDFDAHADPNDLRLGDVDLPPISK